MEGSGDGLLGLLERQQRHHSDSAASLLPQRRSRKAHRFSGAENAENAQANSQAAKHTIKSAAAQVLQQRRSSQEVRGVCSRAVMLDAGAQGEVSAGAAPACSSSTAAQTGAEVGPQQAAGRGSRAQPIAVQGECSAVPCGADNPPPFSTLLPAPAGGSRAAQESAGTASGAEAQDKAPCKR